MTKNDEATMVRRARKDIAIFARLLVGAPLWDHQLDLATSKARTRVCLAGRQCGKSRVLAVIALFEAFTGANRLILVVSATDDAAKRLLAEIGGLLRSPLLAGAVIDENKSEITLSNGSVIHSVPASERQVRGWTAHLLIVDEATLISDDVLKASRYTTITTGGRMVLAGTPWGPRDRFCAVQYAEGLIGSDGVASFCWPSMISPLVPEELIAEWRSTMTQREFDAEIMGIWPDAQGAYFDPAELAAAVEDWPMLEPARAGGVEAFGGVDFGMRDANTLAAIVQTSTPTADGRPVFWVSFVLERFGMGYEDWIDELLGVAEGYRFVALACETNGVGAAPTQILRRRMLEAGRGDVVVPVTTTLRSKELGFGTIKLLLQSGRLRLPQHPELLKQLAALEYTTTDSGLLRISVPERRGHDDLAMALSMAAGLLAEGETLPSGVVFVSGDEIDERERDWFEFLQETKISDF